MAGEPGEEETQADGEFLPFAGKGVTDILCAWVRLILLPVSQVFNGVLYWINFVI